MKDIRKDLLDELLEDYERPENLLGEEAVLKSLQKALMERAFGSELTDEQLIPAAGIIDRYGPNLGGRLT